MSVPTVTPTPTDTARIKKFFIFPLYGPTHRRTVNVLHTIVITWAGRSSDRLNQQPTAASQVATSSVRLVADRLLAEDSSQDPQQTHASHYPGNDCSHKFKSKRVNDLRRTRRRTAYTNVRQCRVNAHDHYAVNSENSYRTKPPRT